MTDFTTLSDVKAWLQTGTDPFPSRDDDLLSRLITGASAFIESWLARSIRLANWQEIRDGLGGLRADRMVLAVTPIRAVLSLKVDGISIPPAPPLSSSTRFGFGYTFTPTELGLRGYCFTRGMQNVTVQYTAGYDPIPWDIQQACLEMVVRKYRERTRTAERTHSLGGVSTVSYVTSMFGLHDMATDIQTLLSQYRQAAPLLGATLLEPPPTVFEFEDSTTVILLEDGTPITQEP